MTQAKKMQTRKRLLLTILLVLGVSITASLVVYALRSNIDFFYTPGDIIHGKNGVIPKVGQRMQIGGMVQANSVRKKEGTLEVNFVVYDNKGTLNITYTGILPDLFEEEQSVVVKGVLQENATVVADTILAKHDENYTPPEVEKAMQENHSMPKEAYQPNKP